MSPSLSSHPDLAQLKRQAKELLKARKAGDPSVCDRLRKIQRFADMSNAEILAADIKLAEAQHALAKDYGFNSWPDLSRHVLKSGEMDSADSRIPDAEQVLAAYYRAMNQHDPVAMRQFLADDFVAHVDDDSTMRWTADQIVEQEAKHWQSYQDVHYEVLDVVQDGNKVTYRVCHTGTLRDSAYKLKIFATSIARVINGKFTEAWLSSSRNAFDPTGESLRTELANRQTVEVTLPGPGDGESPNAGALPDLEQRAQSILDRHQKGDRSVCDALRKVPCLDGRSDDQILRTKVRLEEARHVVAVEQGFHNWQDLLEDFAAQPGKEGSTDSDVAEIRRANREFYKCFSASDLEGMKQVWADANHEFILSHDTAALGAYVRDIELKNWTRILGCGARINICMLTEKIVVRENYAWVYGDESYRGQCAPEEKSEDDWGTFDGANTFVRTSNGWKMVSHRMAGKSPGSGDLRT